MSENAPAAAAPAPAPKEKIIVAEDSAPNRKILSHLLQKLGYEVLAVENGKQAQDLIMDKANHPIAAILSDVMMPEMDGISLLKEVRGHQELKDTPFVLVTAVADKEYIVQAKALNVNGYILKPVTFQKVQAKLQELFPKKQFPKIAA